MTASEQQPNCAHIAWWDHSAGCFDAQQQPRASGYGQHVYLPDSRAGDDCAGCGKARADPAHVWPGASERGESAILNCVVDYEITSLCQNTKLIADLRARLADAKKQRDYWLNLYHEIEDAKAEVEIERDAAQREAQALREGNERLLQALGIYGEHLDSCWLRQTNITAVGQSRCNCGYFAAVGKALASTDRGGRDGELTDG